MSDPKKPVEPDHKPKVKANTEVDAFMLFAMVFTRPIRYHKTKHGGEFWYCESDIGNPPYPPEPG